MSKNINHLQHVKSNVVIEGKPKLPQPNSLVDGELAINYAKGYETLSLKNSSGEVITFSSDEYYTEQKLGSGFTSENSAVTVTDVIVNINESKLDVTAYTPTIVDQVIDSTTSASTNAVSTSGVYDFVTSYSPPSITVDQVIDDTTSASTNAVATQAVYKVIVENEEIVSAALNDLETNKLDVSAYTPVDLSNYYTKDDLTGSSAVAVAKANSASTASTVALAGITDADDIKAIEALTGTSGLLKKTAANEWTLDTTTYSSATDVNTALGGKSDTGHTHDDRYYTESELTGSSTTVVVSKAASATTAASASNASTVNNHSVNSDVPSDAVFTDTTYKLNVNGIEQGGGATSLGTVYAPTAAGTEGQMLIANASGIPTWGSKPSYSLSEVGAITSAEAITADTSSSCSITGASNSGKSETIIYTNSSGADLTVTVPTTYATPDGADIELTCPDGGYCEVNYLNIGGTIYARGL